MMGRSNCKVCNCFGEAAAGLIHVKNNFFEVRRVKEINLDDAGVPDARASGC